MEINYYGKLLPEIGSRIKKEINKKKNNYKRGENKTISLRDITDSPVELSKLMKQEEIKREEMAEFPKKNYLRSQLLLDLEENLNLDRFFIIFGIESYEDIKQNVTEQLNYETDCTNYELGKDEEELGENRIDVDAEADIDNIDVESELSRLIYNEDTEMLFRDVEWILKELLNSISYNIFFDKRKKINGTEREDIENDRFLSGFDTKYDQFDSLIRLLINILFFDATLSKAYCEERWIIISKGMEEHRRKNPQKNRQQRKKEFYNLVENSFDIFWKREREYIVESFRGCILEKNIEQINSETGRKIKMSNLNKWVEEWLQTEFKSLLQDIYEEYKADSVLGVGYEVKNLLKMRESYIDDFVFELNSRKASYANKLRNERERNIGTMIKFQQGYFKTTKTKTTTI